MLVLGLLVCISSVSAVDILTCSPSNFTCPGSVVNCECQARSALRWGVTSQMTGEELLRETYSDSTDIGIVTSMNGYTVVLCSVDASGALAIFTSKLNFMFRENVSVTCQGLTTVTATLQIAGPPSPPVNLQYTLLNMCTATDSVTVRLDWDPPLDDGGVAIIHYQISVNMSEPVITTDTVATFTLNSTGEHLVQVRVVNCAGVSAYSSTFVTVDNMATTGEPTIPSTTKIGVADEIFTTLNTIAAMDTSGDGFLTISTPAIIGVAISLLVAFVVVYTCGVLTGLLVERKKRGKSSPTSASGDPVPMYEEVVLPTQTNVSYGHFKPTVQ